MKALFLVGGMEAKLKPFTNEIPKPMVPIMNKPLLQRSMENLKKSGIHDFIISTGYPSKYIEHYFGNGSKFGMHIEYVYEDVPSGTGVAIKNTGHLFNETFLVFNADILCNIDYTELIEYHKSQAAAVTIAVTQVDSSLAHNVIEHDELGYVTAFTEKPLKETLRSYYINACVYVIEPEVLAEIPMGRPVSLEGETFPLLLQKGYKIAIYKNCSYWMDIGTPAKYLQSHEDIMKGHCRIAELEFSEQNIIKEGKSRIDSTAIITGPVYIGKNVVIGAYATIGPNAVIGDRVSVREGGSVVGSILWNNVDVGRGAEMFGMVAASDCRIERKASHRNTAFSKSGCIVW